jgi:hypothetical protein
LEISLAIWTLFWGLGLRIQVQLGLVQGFWVGEALNRQESWVLHIGLHYLEELLTKEIWV